MASSPPPPIRPLPDSVRARLRSTLALSSLRDAVSELLQNSLDAGAKTLTVQANLSRNSCVVSDDGAGIAPEQMGLVATQHATSKYPPPADGPLFGSRGEALAALGAHSLLTVTSRSAAHRSTHTVRISYGARILAGPAPEHQRLPSHGTVVRVEGLWGNMPVRLRARESQDREREWEDVKRAVVELLLSPPGRGVAAVLRDETGNRRLAVKGGDLRARAPWEVRVLALAYGRDAGGAGEAWERVRAKQNGVAVEGWIALTGAPSRAWQYLYINNHPLPPATTVLHAEINRIFAASLFGTTDEEDENGRRSSTMTRGGLRKGVDRHAMFVLRIERQSDLGVLGGEGGTDGKAGVEGENLKQVISLLQKLVYEFLKAHHFRPVAIGSRAEKPPSRSATASPRVDEPPPPPERWDADGTKQDEPLASVSSLEHRFRSLDNWSRAKAARSDPTEEAGRTAMGAGPAKQHRGLAVEASSTPVITTTATRQAMGDGAAAVDNGALGDDFVLWTDPVSKKRYELNTRTGNTRPLAQAAALSTLPGAGTKRPASSSSFSSSHSHNSNNSRRISITPSPSSKRARPTPPSRPTTTFPNHNHNHNNHRNAEPPGEWVQQLLSKWKNPTFAPAAEAPIPAIPLRLPPAVPDDGAGGSHALGGDAPFTEATTQRLGRLTKAGLGTAEVIAQVDRKYILIKMRGRAHDAASRSNSAEGDDDHNTEILVAVDQHAADERVRVESLFQELASTTFTSTASLSTTPSTAASRVLESTQTIDKPLTFQITPRDALLLERYRPEFERWGITYDVAKERDTVVVVRRLPRVAAERCAAEPVLAIEMLRRHVHELDERRLPPLPLPRVRSDGDPEGGGSGGDSGGGSGGGSGGDSGGGSGGGEEGGESGASGESGESGASGASGESGERTNSAHGDGADWVRAISRAPKALVEMVNSRACRGAVMFNDPLTREECAALIARLARTRFPFLCAHGRPCVVPLVDLGVRGRVGAGAGAGAGGERGFAERERERGDGQTEGARFRDCWERWRESAFAGLHSRVDMRGERMQE